MTLKIQQILWTLIWWNDYSFSCNVLFFVTIFGKCNWI